MEVTKLAEVNGARAGKVFLVGAGPGDPRLLTLRAARLLEEAEVIVYDRLVPEEILCLVPEGKELICVGKTPGKEAPSQDAINEILLREAKRGRLVLRLKGGDPFLFGRGGEEALFLARRGIDYEVVPGVSSALAAPAGAGIPVTHRGVARSLAVVTGNTCEGGIESVDLEGISASCDTLVVLMGSANLGEIASRVMASGRSPGEPAAAISWGSTGRQRSVIADLGSLESKVREAGLSSPLLLVIGRVVEMGNLLRRREQLPLHGKRILTLRDHRQARPLCLRLTDLGASARNVPAVRISANHDPALDRLIKHVRDFRWTVFTSPNAVKFFMERMLELGHDARDMSGSRMVAMGPGTEKALLSWGLRADLVPREHSTHGLMASLADIPLAGEPVLLCRSNLAPPGLAEFLRRKGATVKEAHPYRTEVANRPDRSLILSMERSEVDIILLTSPSTAEGLLALLDGKTHLLSGITVGCIGPVTGERARELGIDVAFVADDHSEDGLVKALLDHLGVKTDGQIP